MKIIVNPLSEKTHLEEIIRNEKWTLRFLLQPIFIDKFIRLFYVLTGTTVLGGTSKRTVLSHTFASFLILSR